MLDDKNCSELLKESAKIAYEQSLHLCDGCSYYHGLWQYLRLFDIMTSPYNDKFLYDKALDFVEDKNRVINILISGASDYGILQTVLDLILDKNLKVDITVLDLCDTTLYMNQWYANRFNIKINVEKEDILLYSPNVKYDVIISHSFLGRFDEIGQVKLFEKWHDLLFEDGIIVSTSQIRVGKIGWQTFDELQRENYLKKVLENSLRFNDIDLEENIISSLVKDFTKNFTTFAIPSEDYLRNLIENSNFKINYFETKGKANSNISPCTKGEKLKAYFIAQKV